MANQQKNRKFHRIFFSTDLHASEVVFRKFIGVAKFYEVDTLIMGGDITGKTIVPLVTKTNGTYHFNFQGQEFDEVSAGQLPKYETRIIKTRGFIHIVFRRASTTRCALIQARSHPSLTP